MQAFEFCDQPWLPGPIREGFMDCLNAIHRLWQPYRHIAPIVCRFAQSVGASELLDLGSGENGCQSFLQNRPSLFAVRCKRQNSPYESRD
ncbi:hypothetical protein JCM13664_17630 [Methylothermus subterraneus]